MPNIDFRDSQSYVLGSGFQGNAIGHQNVAMTASRDIMLGRLIQSNQFGTFASGDVTACTVQGQSILTSNQPAALRGFNPNLADDGANYIGVPLVQNGVVSITSGNYYPALPAASISLTWGCFTDPWDTSKLGPVPPPDAIGPAGLNYVCGLGQVTTGIPAGSVGTLQCTVLRDVQLGMLYLEATDVAGAGGLGYGVEGSCVINNIRINQTEQLASNAAIPLSAFNLDSKDEDMKTLGVIAPMNSTLQIVITNNSGVAVTLAGHFYCLPS